MPDVLKRVPAGREQWQSRALVWVVGTLLVVAAIAPVVVGFSGWVELRALAVPFLLSTAFALVVWGLRAATGPAAVMGFFVCFILMQRPVLSSGVLGKLVFHPAIPALVAVFVLAFAATKFGKAKKEARGLAERRKGGRAASQIIANLGVAALAAVVGSYAGCIAALAEAAADTVSSEIGQAVGGPACLITSWRRVPPGTDGGLSLVGTMAGVAGAAVIVGFGAFRFWPDALVVFVVACAGLLFDSLLGATVERWGWVGNDWVNFASTLFAAVVAGLLARVGQ